MKNLSTSILIRFIVFFLFLVSLLTVFFFVAPKIEAPANAASCSVTSSSVQAGGSKTVTHNGFASGESIRLFGVNAQVTLETTSDSLGGSRSQSVDIPTSIPPGDYNIVIVTRFPVTSTTCSGGPFAVTAPTTTYTCNYTFNTPVASGGAVNVNITSSGNDSGDLIRASIQPGGDVDSRTGPGNITLTAPTVTSTSTFSVLAGNNTKGVVCSGNSTLTVNAGTSTGSWTISDPTVSGTSVTFNWTPNTDATVALLINDQDDPAKTVVWDNTQEGVDINGRSTITVSTSTWNVGAAIDGCFRVTLVDRTFGSIRSNQPIFDMGGCGAPPPPPPPPPPTDGGPYTVVLAIPTATAGDIGNALNILIPNGTEQNITGTSYTFTAGRIPAEWNAKDVKVYICAPNCSTATNLITAWNPNPKLCTTNADGSITIDWGTNSCTGALPPLDDVAENDCTKGGTSIDNYACGHFVSGTYDIEATTAIQLFSFLDGMNIAILGYSVFNPHLDSITANTGALATSGNMVASLYGSPPVSGVEYFASQFRKFNPVQEAYAQEFSGGIGYNTLQPVQKIWTAFRNMAYVGFVIVFVVIGFMVMFRSKISPQAVATVQDSLPRIVVALILVTFSYAIAGLMIDFMFLFLNVAINALAQADLISLDRSKFVFEDNVFKVIWSSWTDNFGTVFRSLNQIIKDTIDLDIPFIPGTVENAAESLLGTTGATLGGIVVGIALLFIMFRIFLMLLMAYVMIILLTMAAPFYFLIQALPGNNGARDWFKNMASNVAVFPTVALMFIFAGMLGGIDSLGGTSSQISHGNVGQFPLLVGGLDAGAIGELIAIGILLITPTAAELVRNALGVKGGPNFAGAAMSSLGAGAGVAMAGARMGYKGAQSVLPSGYESGEATKSRWRFASPAYWHTRGQMETAVKESRAKAIGEDVVSKTGTGLTAKRYK